MNLISNLRIDAILKLSIIVLAAAGIYYFVTSANSKNSQEILKSQSSISLDNPNPSKYDIQTYRNTRFGFSIDFPKSWPTGKESDNGDGEVIYNVKPDNQILVYGSNVPSTFSTQGASVERNTVVLDSGVQATSLKEVDVPGKIKYIVFFNQNNKQYIFYADVTELFFNSQLNTIQSTVKSFRVNNQALQASPTTPTLSYRQVFINNCQFGNIYCTCLYNVLHQDYSDAEISNDLKVSGANYMGDAMFANAFAECNSRFNSK